MSDFFHTYPLLVPAIVWCVAQGSKVIIRSAKRGFNWRYFVASGGMPSGHSSVAVSILTVVGILEGIYSLLFAIVFVFSCVVLYDAMNVRQQAGMHAAVLNTLLKKEKEDFKPFDELLGHTPLQVLIGGIIGFALSLILLNF